MGPQPQPPKVDRRRSRRSPLVAVAVFRRRSRSAVGVRCWSQDGQGGGEEEKGELGRIGRARKKGGLLSLSVPSP